MRIGVIGGSGLYELEGLSGREWLEQTTPFGTPSDAYLHGSFGSHEVYFLPRHGRGHRLMPSEINHRANLFGMKQLGVECILSFSAVGSLREDFRPRDIVLPDQYFDRTKQSGAHTFFGEGIVAHVAFGEPACRGLRGKLAQTIEQVMAKRRADADAPRLHVGGTYVCMEGPAFSTKAESNIYRKLGCDLIGMTSLPEAKLAREAGLCYQSVSMITDYDCWHESEAAVSVEMVVEHMHANASLAKEILRAVLQADLALDPGCTCRQALSTAIATDRGVIPAEVLERLAPLL